MRKHQQRNILELLNTIKEAQSAGLYADCQEGALSIGEFIEDIEGEGTQTVSYLEEYCDLLYEVSNGNLNDKQLIKHLVKIENSVKSELKPNRIEVVFLSYKASMGDSLESIYLAAKADPSCDAYWIPVPYYERKADGTVGEMHYEGPEYYNDTFECADWQTYDIEARRPDAIYTFNPYDAGNFVTSIHPAFYCERLSNHTDMLVYVPYFVVPDDVPAHFCVAAGCVFANRVILQSERVRNIYIRIFREAYNDRFGNPEEKFVALGSPKIDKVLMSRREDFILPDAWAKVIRNKRAVFYNTSVGSLLTGNKQYLSKLRSVINDFRNNNDLVLWWRPHPLQEATLESMRPQFLEEYQQIVSDFKQDNFGIFDDTADLHRALIWTDMYYGDISSLITMYMSSGKPTFMQYINNVEESIVVQLDDIAIDNNGHYWGFDYYKDMLVELDPIEHSICRMIPCGDVPVSKGKQRYMFPRFLRTYISGCKVICFPYCLDYILVYDKETEILKKTLIDKDYLLYPDYEGSLFNKVVEYSGCFYCFGYASKAVVIYDSHNETIKYDTTLFDLVGLLDCNNQYVKMPLYISEVDVSGSVIILMKDCNSLISYSLTTSEIMIIVNTNILTQIIHADFDGLFYWMITDQGDSLIKWNTNTLDSTYYEIPPNKYPIDDLVNMFSGISDCGEFLLLFPALGDTLLKFDKNTCLFSEFDEIAIMQHQKGTDLLKFSVPKRLGDKLYAFARYNGAVCEIDRTTGIVTQQRFIMNDTLATSFYKNCNYDLEKYYGYEVFEGFVGNIAKFLALSVPLRHIQPHELHKAYGDFSANSDGTAGRNIHYYIKDHVGV